MSEPKIRLASRQDAEAIHRIYAPIVRDTAISFEWDVPTVSELADRVTTVLRSGYPWLVAEASGVVAGYACASSFRTRTAYSWAAEVSVYVHPRYHRRGVGRSVYSSVLDLLELQGYRSAYGVATAPNPSSEALHRSMGFEQAGYLHRVGYKFGEWHDVIFWRIGLGPQDGTPDPIRPLKDVLSEGTFLADQSR